MFGRGEVNGISRVQGGSCLLLDCLPLGYLVDNLVAREDTWKCQQIHRRQQQIECLDVRRHRYKMVCGGELAHGEEFPCRQSF